jgi:hypothetical protein
MHLRRLLAALAVSVAWGGAAEAAPKAAMLDSDKVQTAYAQYRYGYAGPRYRRAVFRNHGYRRPVRAARYARPYRYGYYRPAPVVPYGYYGWPHGYYSPVRYYAGYGWPYYGYGRPYGGISIGIGF